MECVTQPFADSIVALDLGCGTGRLSHCLRKVQRSMAIDVSEHMIAHALQPVRADQVTSGNIELLVGDAFSDEFTELELDFDLIYLLGILGEYVAIDEVTVRRLHKLLCPKGVAFFTATDALSRIREPEAVPLPFMRRLVRRFFPYVAAQLREALNRHLSPNCTTEARLHRLLEHSGFERYTIDPYEHGTGWYGCAFGCTVCHGQ